MWYVLAVLVFVRAEQPVVASQTFEHLSDCQHMEGDTLTSAYNDDTVDGFLILQECVAVSKVSKG